MYRLPTVIVAVLRVASCVGLVLLALPTTSEPEDVAGAQPAEMLQPGVLRLKCPGNVSALVFSPDSKLLAAGGSNRSINIWAVGQDEPIQRLAGHGKEVLSLAFSPNGKQIASGSLDRRVRVFELDKFRLVHTLAGHQGGVYGVAFSPDGTLLASGSADFSFKLWDPKTGEPRGEGVSPVQRMLKCEEDDQGRRYFKFRGRGPDGKPGKTMMRGFYELAFSPDGKLLIGAQDIPWGWMAWNIAEGKRTKGVLKHLQGISWIVFSPDGKTVASSWTSGKKLSVQTLTTGEMVKQIELPKPFVRRPRYSADGRTLTVLAGEDKKCSVYFVDLATGKVKRTIDCPPSAIYDIDFSPDGQFLAAASDRAVLVWFLKGLAIHSGAI